MFKILLASNQEDRMLFRKAIESLDKYSILEVEDGLKALEVIYKEEPDVAILNVSIPGENGFEVCKEIKENPITMDIPVVLLGTWEEAVDRIHAYNTGADFLLRNLFQEAEIVAILEKCIRRKQYAASKEHMASLVDFMCELIIAGKVVKIIPEDTLKKEQEYCTNLAKHFELSEREITKLTLAVRVQDWYAFIDKNAPSGKVKKSFEKLRLAEWLNPLLDIKETVEKQTLAQRIFAVVITYGKLKIEKDLGHLDRLTFLRRAAINGEYDINVVEILDKIVRAENVLEEL